MRDVDADLAGDRRAGAAGIGRAADRRVQDDRVLERLARQDLARA